MKKLFLLVICMFVNIAVTNAQEDIDSSETTNTTTSDSKVWKHSKRSYSLGWVIQDFAPEYSSVYNSKFGGMMKYDRTFFLHRKPIAGIVKIGLDAVWTDLTIVKLDADNGSRTDNWNSLTSDNEDDNTYNIGMWTATYSMGIGPSVTIAPFAKCNGGIKYLKAKVYGHYKPSYTAQLISEDGDLDAKGAFCNMFEIGGKITYKLIGVGVEGNWGNGKFDTFMNEIFTYSSGVKVKHKIANTRIYFSFNF